MTGLPKLTAAGSGACGITAHHAHDVAPIAVRVYERKAQPRISGSRIREHLQQRKRSEARARALQECEHHRSESIYNDAFEGMLSSASSSPSFPG